MCYPEGSVTVPCKLADETVCAKPLAGMNGKTIQKQ